MVLKTICSALLLLFPAEIPILHADTPQPDLAGGAALKRLSLEELSQIDVTSASREPQQAFQLPVAIYVITAEDIRRSGAPNIPEALRLAPGVEVARIDSNKWSIGIRGFGSRFSRSVLVLMDGRTVYTTLLAGTYWEVQDTVMEDIDRIEIIRGPGGAIWGPNAVNGVINIITKDAKDTRGLLATVGGGRLEQGFATLRYGGGNNKDFNYRVYGKSFTRGPESHSDRVNFDDWRSVQGGFRMDWNEHDRDMMTLQSDFYDEVAGERVQAISYTPPYQRNVDGNAELSGGNILGKWKHALSDKNDIQVQAYYDRTNRHEPNFGELRDTFDVDFLQHAGLPWRQRVTWGAGVRLSRGHDIQVVSGLTFNPPTRIDRLYTAFLQDEIALVENRLTLTVGSKLLRTNFTNFEFEPSARLIWMPNKTQSIWASFTHSVRTPSDAEENFNLSGYIMTTATGTPYFARFNANTGFRPEQLNGTELGYRQLAGKKLLFGIASFYNHYHNLFDEEITGSAFLESDPAPVHYLLPAKFGNGLMGTTRGFEIAPEYRPAAFWRLRGSYSYLIMDIKKAPGSLDVGLAPGIVGASPRHQAVIQSGMDLSKTLSLDLTYRYVSALVSQGVPGYSTADAHLGWHRGRHVDISFIGRNLLQPTHAEFAGDPGPLVGIKREIYGKITWSE
ncbi:MAG: TonB-dependent receptor [Acidobacteriota bacterium]|nr:TonB-dependent receptor [Acidobacteriota bacterium]